MTESDYRILEEAARQFAGAQRMVEGVLRRVKEENIRKQLREEAQEA